MEPSPDQEGSKKAIFDFLVLASLGYFLFRLLLYATQISHYVPPDELTHFGVCKAYSEALLFPQNSEKTYRLGLVTNIPYLYYFLMGKLLYLNFSLMDDLIYLRFINCLLSTATVILAYRWMRLVTSDSLCHVMMVVLLTNTPMFTFIGASVSYDNLTNLFAAAALYYLHLSYEQSNHRNLFLFLISSFGGCLTKLIFIPFAVVLFVLAGMAVRKGRLRMSFSMRSFRSVRWGELGMGAVAALLLILNMSLYLKNAVSYGTIYPRADQILTVEQAMKNRIYASEMIPLWYERGEITWDEALRKLGEIDHPSDRTNTLYALELARLYREGKVRQVDRVEYMLSWLHMMIQRTFGIMAHFGMSKPSFHWYIYETVFLIGMLLFLRYWVPGESLGRLGDCVILFTCYSLVLSQVIGYSFYLSTHGRGSGVQGRYFFPVIVPFYGVLVYYLLRPAGRSVRIVTLCGLSAFFIWGDLPFFLMNASKKWFFP